MDSAIATLTTPPAPAPRPVEPAQRVEPASSAGATGDRNAAGSGARSFDRASAQRSFQRDADTGSLVYRLVDINSGVVAVQTPSDARLKLRAYIDGVFASGDKSAGVEVTA